MVNGHPVYLVFTNDRVSHGLSVAVNGHDLKLKELRATIFGNNYIRT